ncbi:MULTISPECIES: hypothetical protein [Paenibacillus]|nr:MULTISPECIES: hypothetical protein [Paenibacillus]
MLTLPELITHETPILRTQDAEQYFDLAKAAPTLIVRLNRILAFID